MLMDCAPRRRSRLLVTDEDNRTHLEMYPFLESEAARAVIIFPRSYSTKPHLLKPSASSPLVGPGIPGLT